QEQQYHQHDQRDGQRQGELDVTHGSTDGASAVLQYRDIDGRGNVPEKPGQQRPDLVDRVDDVGAGLLEHHQQNAPLAILKCAYGLVRGTGDGLADIANPDWAAVPVGEDGVVERLRVDDLVVRRDGETDVGRIDSAFRGNSRRVDEDRTYVLQRQSGGSEL